MRLRRVLLAGVLAAAAVTSPAAAAAQASAGLRVRRGGSDIELEVTRARGFAAVTVGSLGRAGWRVQPTAMGARLEGPGGTRIELLDGTPFLTWAGRIVQMVFAPYFQGGDLYVPVQVLTDLLPRLLPGSYRFAAATMTLSWGPEVQPARPDPARELHMDAPARRVHVPPITTPEERAAAERAAAESLLAAGRRVVVIDAGHGGADPGTVSSGGVREKVVALGIARAMAEALRAEKGIEVVLIRDGDVLVPLWDRGARATEVKGERPGIFVSIHANSAPTRNSPVRGFETYFLSEARNEHERRVAAIENAPLGVESPGEGTGSDLDFILRELKNLDQPHWSSLLAELVQEELAAMHPGPDRGVKQAPLAVITNAIMPAVLVEVGYLSHPDEARLLAQAEFQREAGEALAEAVIRFFQRYPPGTGGGAGEGR